MCASSSLLDQLYAASAVESAAVALAQAPEFVRALRDIRERDFCNPWLGAGVSRNAERAAWDEEHARSEHVVLREGRVVRLTRGGSLRVDDTRWEYQPWQIRNYPGDQFARDPMLERLTGDQHAEELFRLGGWGLEDGCTVTIDREHGIGVDYSTRRKIDAAAGAAMTTCHGGGQSSTSRVTRGAK